MVTKPICATEVARYTGYFFDGNRAARIDVTVRLGASSLEIQNDSGVTIAAWRYQDLGLVDQPRGGRAVRLKSARAGPARLTVDDARILPELRKAWPEFGKPKRLDARLLRSIAVWAAGTAAVLAIIGVGIQQLAGLTAALIPASWQEAIGEKAADQIVALAAENGAALGGCTNPPGRRALDRLVGRLAATVDPPRAFHIRVADISPVNAFAAPGGHIVVLRGLLDSAKSPDEVAGVLAHEMAHEIEGHALEAVIRNMGYELVFNLLLGDISGGGVLAGIGEMMIGLSYSRKAEAEADAIALEMLAAAGIRTGGLAEFFERLGEDERRGLKMPPFLSTHPPSEARAKAAKTFGEGGGPALGPEEWAALKSICAGRV